MNATSSRLARVALGILTIGVVSGCSSSSSSSGGSSDAGGSQSADAGNKTSSDDAGTVAAVDSGGDANAGTGPGGCLTGNETTACTVTDPSTNDGGAGACITGDFCTSVSGLNTEVAASVVACETADTSAPACTKVQSCVLTALALACPDSTTSQPCASVISACGDAGKGSVSETTCEATLAGINATTRTVFANCWATSCDLDTCVTNLFSP